VLLDETKQIGEAEGSRLKASEGPRRADNQGKEEKKSQILPEEKGKKKRRMGIGRVCRSREEIWKSDRPVDLKKKKNRANFWAGGSLGGRSYG